MKVFVDTEFTSLLSPALLSIGLVADTAAPRELYAELDLQSEVGRRRRKASNEFVHSAVLPQWGRVGGAECSDYELGARAGQWLLGLISEITTGAAITGIEILYDYWADAALLKSALKVCGLFDELKPFIDWSNVAYLVDDKIVDAAQEASWARTFELHQLERHHALADARALRAGFLAMHGPDAASVLSSYRGCRTDPRRLS